ncbi:hypothetical protein TeGR_g14474, partial [Tetraparma gracilis]
MGNSIQGQNGNLLNQGSAFGYNASACTYNLKGCNYNQAVMDQDPYYYGYLNFFLIIWAIMVG